MDTPPDSQADAGVPVPPGDAGQPQEAAVPPVPTGSRYLTFVAHPDDDILFFNPDLEDAMRQGASSSTVYVTSGDASDPPWQGREMRVMSAQAGMAGARDAWSCQTGAYAGHGVSRCTLADVPRVSTIFMRLPDGFVMTLWDGSASSLQRIDDPSTSYTHAQLSSALAAMMAEVVPTRMLAMDGTGMFGNDDHPDHVASALFAQEAAQSYAQLDVLYMYRGYSISPPTPINLSPAQHDEKVRLMGLYQSDVAPGDTYDDWCWRQYSYPIAIH